MRCWIVLPILALGAAACGDRDTVTVTDPGQLAHVRYVHAMPDTGAVDVRLIDRVENLDCYAKPYRAVCPYQGIVAGERRFRVFTSSTGGDINVVSQIILDTIVPLQANTYYTIVHSGYARSGQTPRQRFCVITDNVTAPAAGRFKIRSVVAAPGFAASQDVHLTKATNASSGPAPGAGSTAIYTAPNVTAAAGCPVPTAWAETDTVPSVSATNPNGGAATLYAYNVGTVPPATENVAMTLFSGAPPAGVSSAIAGSRIAGSALTAFLFAAGVAGSPAAGAPAAQQAIDRKP